MAISSDQKLKLLMLEKERRKRQDSIQSPGFMQKVGSAIGNAASTAASAVGNAINQFQQSTAIQPQMTSPNYLLGQVAPDLINRGFEKAGTVAAEGLGREGIDPRLAAAAGTAISMTPDIVGATINPLQAAEIAIPKGAIGLGRRSLGLQKRFLATPFARGQAQKAAEVALQENIIPIMGNPEVAMERAKTLATKSGQGLEKMRGGIGPTRINRVFDELENLRTKLVKGRTGGEWDKVNSRIDSAADTLQGLLNKGEKISLNDVIEAKTRIKGATNYLADLSSQGDTKKIVRAIEQGVTRTLGEKGADMRAYRKLKREFGAAKLMQTGLSNELAIQQGNDLISLSGKLAALIPGGGALTAPLKAGVMELGKRRGAAMGARAITSVAGGQRQAIPMSTVLINALNRNKRKK